MTTTIRPLEPERQGPRGGRTRRYAVCVNSRQVGEILVGTKRFGGTVSGEISELRIDEPDRRRGRATVAVLAAEEVLRQRGCARVEAEVPGGSDAALRLATALGYTERSRRMAKRLAAAAPPLPDGVVARAMTEAEFPVWMETESRGYAEELIGAGSTPDEARAKSDASNRELLPEGVRTPGAVLRILASGGTDVGTLWVAVSGPVDSAQAWVYAVDVDEAHRGRGHGRALMLLAEAECLAAGVGELGLNVFSENTPALRLYESLGYRVTTHCLVKPLL